MEHMASIEFYKYQGTGNDFVVVDNRSQELDRTDKSIAKKLCDRKFGVGSDGLILIENHDEFDFEMVFFNPDGSQSMCGNGSRCAVKFAQFLGVIKDKTTFVSTDGVHEATIDGDIVRLSMQDVAKSDINTFPEHFTIHTGSPHYVIFASNIKDKDVKEEGANIRYSDEFMREGINVNFVEKQSVNKISVRTYERGVENETLSCGTGVTACAIAHVLHGGISPVEIETLGGQLSVEFELVEGAAKNVWLTGPAKNVFKGEITL
jgi:diaminopimelate epimerase